MGLFQLRPTLRPAKTTEATDEFRYSPAGARRGAIPASAALMFGLLGSSGAWAQCTTTLPPAAGAFLPFVQSGAVNSLVSSINTVNTAFLTQSTAFVSAPGGAKPDQQGGGAWGRVIVGSTDTDSKSNAVADLTAVFGRQGPPGQPIAARRPARISPAVQVGHDISILNGGGTGANFHVGVTAGYVKADSKDITAGATFSNSLDVPFVGVYAAFTKGGFFADGQARWDAYQNTVTDPALGFSNQQFNATGWSLTGNVGYNIPVHGNWFIEPSGGVSGPNVKVDPLNVAGPEILWPQGRHPGQGRHRRYRKRPRPRQRPHRHEHHDRPYLAAAVLHCQRLP